HTRWPRDWSSDVCSSDLIYGTEGRISIGIPFNIPPDRPSSIFVTHGGEPPVAPATETVTFPTADPYTVEADAFASAILDGRPTRSEERRVGKEVSCGRWA